MAMGFNATLRTARAQKIIDAIDAGTGPGTLKFYTGTRPATGEAITTETLLGTCIFSDPCGTISNGVLTFSAVTQDAAADASGVCSWARVQDSAGVFVMDLAVGGTGSGADIILNTTSIVVGGPISVTSAVITEGNA